MDDQNKDPELPAQNRQYTIEEKAALPRVSTLDDAARRNGLMLKKKKEALYNEVHWYAVYCTPQHEFQIHDYLMNIEEEMKKLRRGTSKKEKFLTVIPKKEPRMECFVPFSYVHLKYSDRMVWKEKVQTPGIIFVKCKLNERDELFHSPIAEYITGFLNDRENHWPQPIPNAEMDEFISFVKNEYNVQLVKPTFAVGSKVLVLEGALNGRVAEIVDNHEIVSRTELLTDRQGNTVIDSEGNPVYKRKQTLCVRLNSQLAALFEVDADKVVPAPEGAPDYGVYE